MSRLVSFEMPLDTGDFCLMDRRVVKVLNSMPERNRFVRGLRAWSGFRQTGLVYERQSRAAGDAKYNFFKLMKLARDGVFSFSTVPLTLMARAGAWISAVSFLGIIWVLMTKIFSGFFSKHGFPPVQGFTTIVIVILFLGGIQMISLGILGEYIGRIYDEVKRRPPWVIQNSAGIEPKTPDQHG
jgi:polyisoprenyl-phosphate glycosyltransferase